MKKRTRRQKAIIKRNIFLSLCALVLVGAIALIGFVISSLKNLDGVKIPIGIKELFKSRLPSSSLYLSSTSSI